VTTFQKLAEAAERRHRAELARILAESWNDKAKALADRLLSEAGR
jgi:hypothetical protein